MWECLQYVALLYSSRCSLASSAFAPPAAAAAVAAAASCFCCGCLCCWSCSTRYVFFFLTTNLAKQYDTREDVQACRDVCCLLFCWCSDERIHVTVLTRPAWCMGDFTTVGNTQNHAFLFGVGILAYGENYLKLPWAFVVLLFNTVVRSFRNSHSLRQNCAGIAYV